MTINLKLDTQSIEKVIERLVKLKRPLDEDCAGILDALATEGAEEAQRCYGEYPVQAIPVPPQGGSAGIIVDGDMPLIAEFGAGDATEDPSVFFENIPSTPVVPGSYSLLEGSKEYYLSRLRGQGRWHFGGEVYTEVLPHLGLYQAKIRLIDNYVSIVKEEMGL